MVKNIFSKIMAEKFLKLKKETNIRYREHRKIPNKMNPKRKRPIPSTS